MERVEQYKAIAKSVIQELVDREGFQSNPVVDHIVFDDERGHYLLDLLRHILIDYNGQMLLNKGVRKSDLVIGVHSPNMRKDTEFAVS